MSTRDIRKRVDTLKRKSEHSSFPYDMRGGDTQHVINAERLVVREYPFRSVILAFVLLVAGGGMLVIGLDLLVLAKHQKHVERGLGLIFLSMLMFLPGTITHKKKILSEASDKVSLNVVA